MPIYPNTTDIEREYRHKVLSIPEALREELYVPEVTDIMSGAMNLAGIKEPGRWIVNLVALQVFTGDIPPREMAGYFERWLNINQTTSFKLAQHITENLVNKYRDYLTKQFGTGYFSPAGDVETKKPRETTPQLDGNIVNLRGQ